MGIEPIEKGNTGLYYGSVLGSGCYYSQWREGDRWVDGYFHLALELEL